MTVRKNVKIIIAIEAFLTKSQTFLPFLLPEASSLSEPIVNKQIDTMRAGCSLQLSEMKFSDFF